MHDSRVLMLTKIGGAVAVAIAILFGAVFTSCANEPQPPTVAQQIAKLKAEQQVINEALITLAAEQGKELKVNAQTALPRNR